MTHKKLKCWKRNQTSSGFFKKKKGNLPEFVRFERTEYKGNQYVVLHKVGIGNIPRGDRPRKDLGYFKKRSSALKFAKSYMRKHDKC